MRLRLFSGFWLAAVLACGCAHHAPPPSPPGPAQTAPVSTNTATIVTPDNSLSAKVVRYNSVGRFVVLSFPIGQIPQVGQTFFLYHAGMKSGTVKITGPQRDSDIVADLTEGNADVGDDVREQ